MIIEKTNFEDLLIINTLKKEDERGFFRRLYCFNELKKNGMKFNIAQINNSVSKKKYTLRGMHYQNKPFSEIKIIKVISGSIFDVVIDLRKKSKTYKKYFSIELDSNDSRMLVVPEGFAHGFLTLDKNVEVIYFVSKIYNPKYERGIKYNDSEFDILWPHQPTVISTKDQSWDDWS